ncbi:hypothetical protein GCM10007895_03940 [Paraferrimonas sedimenticola]|uniref:Uncharacterized protein n=1 Tax=Paraferrimonas sedimenticola TaxID=375674 RepID=A0AA37RT72_9GAMM|nr:hypothetical protein GCM10007895_03940 [Paraferrimonas sedimenticola]
MLSLLESPFALLDSMRRSKTLTIMIIILVILFGSFFLFLYYMAGKQA